MEIFLYNTLTKKKEPFKPLTPGEVRMYSCGPTVYNLAHIGNLRAYVFTDILRKTLEFNGLKVKQVMNVTDIGHLSDDADQGDDKMVKAVKREGLPMTLGSLATIAKKYTDLFLKDLGDLNIALPSELISATSEIAEQIKMIVALNEKGFTYKISDGIYFDTAKLPDYGRLGFSASEEHSRVGVESEKKDPKDFALWKFSKDGDVGFDAPFGKGFPGWHIECSAISIGHLGNKFDIHTGGIDHIAVHHNNEIAQAEAYTGDSSPIAHFWMHNNHLTIQNGKMAKSEGNFVTLGSIKEKGISPLAYRYWLLTAKYSTRIDFSFEALEAAGVAHKKIKDFVQSTNEEGEASENYIEKCKEFLNDDLDTPKAVALIFDLLRSDLSPGEKKATLLRLDSVLSLGLSEELNVPEKVKELLNKRSAAKANKDYALADSLREQIKNEGFSVLDQKDGSQKLINL